MTDAGGKLPKNLLRALKALENSPAMKSYKSIFKSINSIEKLDTINTDPHFTRVQKAVDRLIRSDFYNNLQELNNLPEMQLARQAEKASEAMDSHSLENSPAFRFIEKIQEAGSLKALYGLEDSPAMRVIAEMADRLSSTYGPLAFSESYDHLIRLQTEMEERSEDPRKITEYVSEEFRSAPTGPLSREFWLMIIFTLIMDYSAKQNHEEAQAEIISAVEQLERSISAQYKSMLSEEKNEVFYVTSTRLNLRSGPSTEHNVIEVLPPNRKLRLLDMNGGWANVEYFNYLRNKNQSGWVSVEHITLIDG
ncbi:SH3 domain-containing protein [Natronospira bacteriovora]|uniref:SH3 domain-containing protein n=1 Tax=Natronospira bacteriovora TaxID=3069753 RepID=A0ABU0W5K4_9GAMM|nr:SH3 domain-containing protein [Natronospira sp. AB-CW4]MDQ2069203.1 SH3 domain-containing protein [Natronospira sp. AB-CW4]